MSSDLQRAEIRAADAKRRLGDTIGLLQSRLEPRHVVNEAVEKLADGGSRALEAGIETAKRNPGKVIGAAAVIAGLLGRHKIAAQFTALFKRRDAAKKPSAPAGVRPSRPRPAPARRNKP